jgi:phosphoenolpyruvate synthase/pyruvate phosphate dikinase
MKYIYDLKADYASRITVAGGKGAQLHKLLKKGYNVPDGLVISSKALEIFINQNNLSEKIKEYLKNIRIDNFKTIAQASDQIKRDIIQGKFPEEISKQLADILGARKKLHFAVRSSGLHEDDFNSSWAGLFDSYLDIKFSDLELYIKKCWASFFNSRAIAYNYKPYRNYKTLKFAVIIQEMINGEKSGIAFSLDPNGYDHSKILIEASRGHGDNLVSGREIPFTILLDKKNKYVLNKSFHSSNNKYLLSLPEINNLHFQIIHLEKDFKKPIDIEWTFSDDKLFLLQIRPITGISKYLLPTKKSVKPRLSNYELTFKAKGISFLFTDILAHAYRDLSPLFLSYKGGFSQYTQIKKIEDANKLGLVWLSKSNGFEEYEARFTSYYKFHVPILERIIHSKKLTKTSTTKFFSILEKFFKYYSRMDTYFTNQSFIYADINIELKENLNQLGKFKDHARSWMNSTALEEPGYLNQFLYKVSNIFLIDKEDLECYKFSEIINLFHNQEISDKEITNRKSAFVIYYYNREFQYFSGAKTLGLINNLHNREKAIEETELNGQVANKKGKIITGIVRVIKVDYRENGVMNQEISQMIKGEILVSEFTAPELISACRKAKAIITDLGGMLSHAAIISRELNVPCLIGTEKATSVFKTGDHVTIDFEQGIAKRTSK